MPTIRKQLPKLHVEGRWNNSLQDVYMLIHRICEYAILHDKRDFWDVIKTKDLEVRKVPEIIQVGSI